MACFNYETNKLLKMGLKAGGLNILYENINRIHADIEVLLIYLGLRFMLAGVLFFIMYF